MELQTILQEIKKCIANGDIDSAFDKLEEVVNKYRKEFEKEFILLKSEYSGNKSNQVMGIVYAATMQTNSNQIVHRMLEFIDLLEDAESQKKVSPIEKGEGTLMHNIPRQMPIDTKTRCTIRIGQLVDKVMENFEATPATETAEITISEFMKVSMSSWDKDAFEIYTVNSDEQYINVNKFTEWRYDIVPKKIGIFPLALKVSAVFIVHEKERNYEQVYEIEVKVNTVKNHLSDVSGKERNWNAMSKVSINNLFSIIERLKPDDNDTGQPFLTIDGFEEPKGLIKENKYEHKIDEQITKEKAKHLKETQAKKKKKKKVSNKKSKKKKKTLDDLKKIRLEDLKKEDLGKMAGGKGRSNKKGRRNFMPETNMPNWLSNIKWGLVVIAATYLVKFLIQYLFF